MFIDDEISGRTRVGTISNEIGGSDCAGAGATVIGDDGDECYGRNTTTFRDTVPSSTVDDMSILLVPNTVFTIHLVSLLLISPWIVLFALDSVAKEVLNDNLL